MRALDIDPSHDEVEMLQARIDPDQRGFFTFQALNMIMEEKLKDVDTFDDLIIELRKLDKD